METEREFAAINIAAILEQIAEDANELSCWLGRLRGCSDGDIQRHLQRLEGVFRKRRDLYRTMSKAMLSNKSLDVMEKLGWDDVTVMIFRDFL